MQVAQEKEIPGPKGKPIIGVGLDFKKDPLAYITSLREYGDIVSARLGMINAIFLFNPEYIKYVLATNNSNYHKGRNYKYLKAVLGEGLVTIEDDTWKRHRQIIQPVFHTSQIVDYIKQFNDLTKDYVAKWSKMGEINDVYEMSALTATIVTKTILGSDVEIDPVVISNAVASLTLHLQNQNNSIFPLPHSIPTPNNRRFFKNMDIINTIVDDIVEKHKNEEKKGNDILSRLLVATENDSDQPLSDVELRDEIRTFFLAGHETTATGLTWTLYLLARHKNIMQNMITEIHNVIGKDGDVTFENIKELVYVEQVANESMRLYPPIYIFARTPLEDDIIDGYRIPKGTTVITSQFALHRSPNLWEDPLEFKPERFEEEKIKNMHKYAYVPFGGGPRTCIGKNFALFEMKVILAKIFQKHYVEMKEEEEIKPTPHFTLRPQKDIILLFKEH